MDKGEKNALWIKDGCCVWSRLSWIRLLMERKGALNNLGARKAGLCREECLDFSHHARGIQTTMGGSGVAKNLQQGMQKNCT